MAHIDKARYNILRIAGIVSIAFGLVLLVSAAAVPTHDEHYCYQVSCSCYNSTASVCHRWQVEYLVDESTVRHHADLSICPREKAGDGTPLLVINELISGFLCWTDDVGEDLHIATPSERTLTNLVTASFTFSVSGMVRMYSKLTSHRNLVAFPNPHCKIVDH